METNSEEIGQFLTQANLARLRQQWDEAIDGCVEALRKEPGNAPAHSLLGDIYRDQGKAEDAAQWYRMAIELHDTPSDTEKLKQTEAEILRRSAHKTVGIHRTTALDAEGTISGGTIPLMGVQPRKWLRVMTVSSLAFLGLMVLLMVVFKSNPAWGRKSSNLRRSNVASFPEAQTMTTLPPVNPNGAIVMPNGERPKEQTSSGPAGSGFEPDSPSPGRTLPADTQQNTNINPLTSRPVVDNSRETPPATVRQVKPVDSAPSDNPLNFPKPPTERKSGGASISLGDEKMPATAQDNKATEKTGDYKTKDE